MSRRWACRGDRGSGTVLLLAVVAVLVVLGGTLGLLARAHAARGQAQAAADLGALAGASAWRFGTGEPCDVASEAVRRNGGRLARCEKQAAGVVAVVALLSTPAGDATAQARAEPRP